MRKGFIKPFLAFHFLLLLNQIVATTITNTNLTANTTNCTSNFTFPVEEVTIQGIKAIQNIVGVDFLGPKYADNDTHQQSYMFGT